MGELDRFPHGKFDQVALSVLAAQSGLGSPQTLSHRLAVNVGAIPQHKTEKESNAGEMTGMLESDKDYFKGYKSEWSLQADYASATMIGFLLAACHGSIADAAAGAGTSHTITRNVSMEPLLFTVGYKDGNQNRLLRLADMAVGSMNLDFATNEWAKASADIKGSGYFDTDLVEEDVAGTGSDTSVDLSNQILDDDKLNVHKVRFIRTSDEVEYYKDCTGANSTQCSFSSFGLSTAAGTYRVLHRLAVAWSSFPAMLSELPLSVSRMTLKIGGTWDGSSYLGGWEIPGQVFNRFGYSCDNKLEVRQVISTSPVDYANSMIIGDPEQVLTFDRIMADSFFQHEILQKDRYTSMYVLIEGELFDSPHRFGVEMIFPKVAIHEAAYGNDNNRKTEVLNLPVKQDSTYGSSIFVVKNELATLLSA